MILENFEEQISPRTLLEGREYFEQKKVTTLNNTGKGKWEAVVAGREEYEVFISFRNNKLFKNLCSCPIATRNGYCKHIVATLLAIKERGEQNEEEKSANRSATEILESFSESEMKNFLLHQLADHPEMESALLDYSRLKVYDEQINTIGEQIKTSVLKYADAKKIIHKHDVNAALKEARNLLQQANEDASRNKWLRATSTVIASLRVLPTATSTMEDPDHATRDLLQKAFDLLAEIARTEIPQETQDIIFKYSLQGAENGELSIFHYDAHWLTILQTIPSNHDIQEKINSLLYKMIAAAKKSDDQTAIERIKILSGRG